ncbi:PspC domain-containing protein [Streptomyces sp. NBC_01498]|uniref:PspC domain-containing protein n=1 Tax=Streptomyces sp. NBC_01498 TaxID=2975870 RepID=UPI002E7C1AE5|nr:PspC domain-containing protein [Streptomyces sp. NBC_01498]WTL25085.1 PspC domain-containing protein [Streptomyces sp. NBC_01498]
MTPSAPHTSTRPPQPRPPQLVRAPRQKVVAGVCGGLGRYCDLDPVIFRIVIVVLTLTGGIGLIFYGFAWLLVPVDGEYENELRRLLSGRVDGASLIAVLLALVGCGLFLSTLNNGGTLGFATMLSIAAIGAGVWSQRRRATIEEGGPLDPGTAAAVAEAPPETKAPPAPGGPSWWRDPIVKDGTTGPVPASGYLWGPDDEDTGARRRGAGARRGASCGRHGPRGIGGTVFLLAVLAGGLGLRLSWDDQPLGTSLQIGLAAALGVFGLGLAVSAFLGRTGFGTLFFAVLTAGLLAASAAVPKDIGTDWVRTTWRPAAVASVSPSYELGTGVGTLDLAAVEVPAGRTLRTSAEVGAGKLKVVVPRDVTLRVRVATGLADIRLPGEAPNDIDLSPGRERTRTVAPPKGVTPGGTLDLRLDVGVGQVEVARAAA